MSITAIDPKRASFFGDPRLDVELPRVNEAFWAALIGHIVDDGHSPRVILDVGCHTGGLLHALSRRFAPAELIGIEPLDVARSTAAQNLYGVGPEVRLLDTSEWDQIAPSSVDLIVSHEMLYMEPDLVGFMKRVRRVLAPLGSAYVVLGSHAENPLWQAWKGPLLAAGHEVFDHAPVAIMEAASSAGLLPAVQPLRSSGWVTYDPLRAHFRYPDVMTMFDYHYRHKLVFRLQ